MTETQTHLVWFKKDLRVIDHAPLFNAVQTGLPVVGVYVIEPEWLQSYECSEHKKQFLRESLQELKDQLKTLNIPLFIFHSSVIEAFESLRRFFQIYKVSSHLETGTDWSYKRDQEIYRWCHEKDVVWEEYKQHSVQRGNFNRDRWNKEREDFLKTPPVKKPSACESARWLKDLKVLDESDVLKTPSFPSILKGGRKEGLSLLKTFFHSRAENYTFEMSSPVTAFDSCSRISPYLSFGTLSVKEVHWAVREEICKHQDIPHLKSKPFIKALKSFESRLWWHDHFIQKLETEPEIEFENMNHGFDGMREEDFNDELFQAWKEGQTGYPLIDACMRALKEEGWINFRMRALLMSFSSYHLWLHWKKPADHLAHLFLDFEPGIHFSQVQMQSGVTGINAIRIYSPSKQTERQDPEGVFIKRYCPELKGLDSRYLKSLEDHPPLLSRMSDFELGRDYPRPIVEEKLAYQKAKDTVYTWKKKDHVQKLSKKVYSKHGSRKSSHFPRQKRSS